MIPSPGGAAAATTAAASAAAPATAAAASTAVLLPPPISMGSRMIAATMRAIAGTAINIIIFSTDLPLPVFTSPYASAPGGIAVFRGII